ncbi:MAG: outer membrane beta-barrel protein [Bacteroidetes bacterium]|nr:outer membrane beta-barrel protein [Bacteroidota bacterium]
MQLGYQRYYGRSFTVKSEGETVTMSEIGLEDIAVNLKEATVVAKRPFIEHHIDKTVVNVENSIINAGSTVLEILKRCPGVTVDNDGNIHLSGKEGVSIMMDGKPTYLSVKDLYDMLRNMNSDQLNSIEIITNPSAKYDAAGNSGIINIKLKKRQDVGLNGNVHGSFGQGAYPDYSGGISLNYGREKFNVFGGYDYGKGYFYERSELSRRFFTNGENSLFSQNSFNKGHYEYHNFQAGADYYIGKKHSISAVVRGNFSDNFSRTTATTNIANSTEVPDSGFVTINTNTSQWNNLSGTLNYTFKIDTLGQELTVDGDIAHYSNRNDYDFNTVHFYSTSQNGYSELATDDQPSKIDVKSFKLDYTLPLKNGFKFDAGTKSSYVNTDNDVKNFNYIGGSAVNDTSKTNHFNYEENIHALYANITGEIKSSALK